MQMDGEPVLLIAAEMRQSRPPSRRHAVAGDLNEMFRLAGEGKGVIGSENFATLRDVRLGDTIDIPAPNGALPVAARRHHPRLRRSAGLAVHRPPAVPSATGTTTRLTSFAFTLRRASPRPDVKSAILDKFKANRRIFVL